MNGLQKFWLGITVLETLMVGYCAKEMYDLEKKIQEDKNTIMKPPTEYVLYEKTVSELQKLEGTQMPLISMNKYTTKELTDMINASLKKKSELEARLDSIEKCFNVSKYQITRFNKQSEISEYKDLQNKLGIGGSVMLILSMGGLIEYSAEKKKQLKKQQSSKPIKHNYIQ